MNDIYKGLALFVAVHKTGSFSAAARDLKLSTSVVSHHIANLEAALGVTLFFRSTRSLSLTTDGQAILEAAQRMVAAGQEALDKISNQTAQAVGQLKLALPAFGLASPVQQAIWDFATENPLVSISLTSSDRQIDLIGEGFDLAIRLGHLTNSALKSRRIGSFHRKLVAAPAYLDKMPPLNDIRDLTKCDFVALSMLPRRLTLRNQGEDFVLPIDNARIEVDAVLAGRAAVLAGLGVMSLPESEVAADLQAGRLIEVLPQCPLPVLGVYAVWPELGPQRQLTRQLIDKLSAL